MEHAKKMEAEFVTAEVKGISADGDVKKISTDKGDYEAKTVILATGADHRKLGVPGEQELGGMGVSYCATCDGAFFRGKTVAVAGGGDVALEDALFLARGCSKVYLIHRRDEFRGAKVLQEQVKKTENIELVLDTVIEEIKGEGQVQSIDISNKKTKEKRSLPVDGVFIAVGTMPNTESFSGLVKMDDAGYIIAGEDTKTSRPGIFAAGDLRTKPLRQVITAAADGANAITAVEEYLHGL
ncbi:thioredoxin reductase [Roseburia sp. CAG:182]|nr:thioredoxin reductase [Roseburia sp. CAG:182]